MARTMTTRSSSPAVVPLPLLIALKLSVSTLASLNCTRSSDCTEAMGPGSLCQSDGTCAFYESRSSLRNPFETGCLYNLLPEWNKIRVCNSEDAPDAAQIGVCRQPDILYREIRVFANNWETSIFEALLLQIILSELLDVPATIETALPGVSLNFYDAQGRLDDQFGYNILLQEQAFDNAVQYGLDCSLADREPENYEPCVHVMPELWFAENPWIVERVNNGIFDTPEHLGMLGKESWFVPKFTAQRNASLLSYLGLQGEHNRQTLAETFLRPTTWNDYCQFISPDGCETPNNITQRPPQDQQEASSYFVDDLYKGHFRTTQKNNCTDSNNCTGHFAGYECTWPGFVETRTHHLGIALAWDGQDPPTEGGYSYEHLHQIWNAANATKSNVIMSWYTPSLLYQTFQGTDAEFVQVALPPPSIHCLDHRVNIYDRCSGDFNIRVGDPQGVCDDPPRSIKKLILASLDERTHNPEIPEAIRSPAYEALDLFALSELQVGDIFDLWLTRSPRDAICQWVANNMDFVNSITPQNYPRVLKEEEAQELVFAAVSIGAVSSLIVMLTGLLVLRQRKRRVMRYAQIEFLLLLLAGSLTISLGAIIVGLPPTNAACVAGIWLINVGYTLELVPLIIKVAAVNRLFHAAQRFKRVRLRRRSLFGAVVVVSLLVTLFLTLWTVLDPPRKQPQYDLTNRVTLNGETVVDVSYYCDSDLAFWNFVSLGWNAILLVCAAVLAFQTRKLRQRFNETNQLAVLIYSHSVFVVFRVVSHLLSALLRGSDLAAFRSIIYSVDTMATVAIYFVPKFLAGDNDWSSSSFFGSSLLSRPLRLSRFSIGGGANEDPTQPRLASSDDVGSASNNGARKEQIGDKNLCSSSRPKVVSFPQQDMEQGKDNVAKTPVEWQEEGNNELAELLAALEDSRASVYDLEATLAEREATITTLREKLAASLQAVLTTTGVCENEVAEGQMALPDNEGGTSGSRGDDHLLGSNLQER